MEVAAALFNSTYIKYAKYAAPAASHLDGSKKVKNGGDLPGSAMRAAEKRSKIKELSSEMPGDKGIKIDKVDLSRGLSLKRINSLLTTEIGKRVDGMLAEAGIDIRAAAGLDWSPEATAGRIFDMTTGLFEIWRSQHPEKSEEALVDSFEKVIRSSVDKGAGEAMAIIGASSVGEGVLKVAEDTMSILHEKYDDYFDRKRSALAQEVA